MKNIIKWFLMIFALVVVYSLFANLYFSWKAQRGQKKVSQSQPIIPAPVSRQPSVTQAVPVTPGEVTQQSEANQQISNSTPIEDNSKGEKTEPVSNPSTPVVSQDIKCKLKFNDDDKSLNINEVIVEYNCTGYVGWACTLREDMDKDGTKVKVSFPSGKTKIHCSWSTNSGRSQTTWYSIKCVNQQGKIKKFDEHYSNYR